MKVLREIAEATSPVIMKRLLPGTTRANARTSLIYQFYKLLRSDKIIEESEIVRKLYGKGVELRDTRYKSLKSRLKKIMLNSFLNEEVMKGGYATYDEALITGYRQLSLARILVIQKAYRASAEVASNAFRNIREYEIIPLNEGLTDALSSLYLGILRNTRLFRKYHALHQYYSRALYDYGTVAGKYRLLRDEIYSHKKSPLEIGKIALNFIEETRGIMEQYPKVPPLQAMVRTVEIMGLKFTGQYREAISAANRTEQILSECKGVSKTVVSGIALIQVECALNLRDFEVGAAQIEKTRKLIPKQTLNSLKLSEYAILLGLYTRNFNYAYEAIIQLDRITLNKLPNDQVSEFWFILEAYIRFLVLAGKIKVPEGDARLKRFRIEKFMNDVPSYVANKQGMNIQVLVLQAMFFIVQGEFDKFRDRTSALARYCNRYLKDNDNLRHNCFFRLLIEVVKGDFDLTIRQTQIRKIHARLVSKEAVEISRRMNSEIVPYEVLWEILEENLGSR